MLTPGGHEYAEAEADWVECFWLAGRCDDGYPPEVGEREMIPFDDPVSDSSMLKIIRRGRAQGPATQGGLKLAAAKVPTTWTSWEGVEHVMPPAGIGDRLRTRMAKPVLGVRRRISVKSRVEVPGSMVVSKTPVPPAGGDPPDGDVWVITDSSDALMKFGEVVVPTMGSIVCGERGLYKHGSDVFLCMERVARSAVKDTLKRFGERLTKAGAGASGAEAADNVDGGDLRSRLVGADGKKAGGDKPADGADEFFIGDEDDSRTLWVDVDAHGLRRKTYEKCILESYAVPYGDSSRIRGPATTLHSMNYFLENGGDPRLWLEVFRGSKNIARTDRVWHELTVLVDMFWYGAMVDQLNLPGLVCFEVLSRRLLAIIEAYSDPSRVNWASSKFYTGAAGLDDAAPAEMRTYVSRAAREMQDLEATRHRAQGQGGKSGGGGDGEEDGSAPSGGRGGGGKGDKGRGSRKTRTPPAPKP